MPTALRICLTMAWIGSSAAADAAILNGFSVTDPLIPLEAILSGGPPKDGIPAITDPDWVQVQEADYLLDSDRVLALNINGLARAYPIKILNYHEIVNDFLGEPVVVSFCPLCGTGIAFRGNVGGRDYTFGVSGLLYNSDVLMYDHQTESLWSQISAQAISGAMKGATLTRIPLTHTTWGDWRERHPETMVLSIETGHDRNYYRNPYAGYASSNQISFPVAHTDSRFGAKELVIGLELGGAFKAYPLSALPVDQTLIDDRLGGQEITVHYDLANLTGRVVDSRGEEIPTFLAFWFAWIAFHPSTEVFER